MFPSFMATYGRKPKAGVDYNPEKGLCQDDYEFLSGTGQYSDDVNPTGEKAGADQIKITVEVEEDGTINVYCSENAIVRIVDIPSILKRHSVNGEVVFSEKCQWDLGEAKRSLVRFTTGLIELREEF